MRLFAFPHWPFLRSEPEVSRCIIGSTGSGKSEGELVDLVRLAKQRTHAIVLLDPHGPLALAAAGHWLHLGQEERLIYEPLDATERVLCWNMLPPLTATDEAKRRLEAAESRDELVQCFVSQRNLVSLADKPWTKEWLEAALTLCQTQPQTEPLASLVAAFRIGSPTYERLLRTSSSPEMIAKFRTLERLKQKNEVQYEMLTGASRRLVEAVANSEVVHRRDRAGLLQWLPALQERRLLVFDGGGLRSRELKRTFFLLVSMQVLHAVRQHFAQTQRPLPVVLVLEEAGAFGLVTPFILTALQELRKAGLAIHILTQSSHDFGDQAIFESVLANTPWQAWYQVLSVADQELGAKLLTNATFEALAVHYTRTRWNPRIRPPEAPEVQHEDYYQPPTLQEQLLRTRLATLRIGERIVRTRECVWQERVRRLRLPRCDLAARTRERLELLRQQPLYQVISEPDRERSDAATRLQQLVRTDQQASLT